MSSVENIFLISFYFGTHTRFLSVRISLAFTEKSGSDWLEIVLGFYRVGGHVVEPS